MPTTTNTLTKPIRSVGVLFHPLKPEALALAEEILAYIRLRGCSVWSGSAWDEPNALANLCDLDVIVTLGGDGTMLRAARMVSCHGIPIVGVKLGRVSFLAEIEPDEWHEPMERLLSGNCWLEERMMLDVTAMSGGAAPANHSYLALNDVVVSRGRLARLISVDAWVDGSFLTSYRADGIIVSTPTGCTGYAMAAGGPILPPELKNLLLIPICAHLSLDRSVVLAQGSTVTLQVNADHPPILTVDGQFEIALADGDRLEVRASEHASRFVHMQDPSYFYHNLMDRLRWRK
jgi:NAD+ kinase